MDNKNKILTKVNKLIHAYKQGILGGEKMPEDENPCLDKDSSQNYMYFTLPMALNYQRNSYVLWECANRMYADKNAKMVFDSREVCLMSEELLRKYLVEYKVALQPNKQPLIWKKLCETIEKMREYVVSKGWEQITEVITQPWGGKTCTLTTIDGCIINIFE